ncbi:uncharacterized protein LOC111396739 [Olea europaea var. sylvestris]|uniref:uncharacterized protein LOC111396739 n=1 Tax=Olea europaea var. sylvestris TaxID=158386 RepID=UPI000C1D3B94|nr:uncharacterized protein LOC111396739 [Olea europaea var. sylvestris]
MDKNKNSQIGFPTSPQPEIVEEITHYTHSKHPLIKVDSPELFTCAGCKEYGAGKRFSCQQCDFQLHDFCTSSPPVLENHPLHGQHQLVFNSKPKQANAGISWPKCDVCDKSTKGFTFRCRACSFQMHPCCAKLSTEMNFPVHPHTLKLLPPVNTTASGTDSGILCSKCKRRRSGRIYRCNVCGYHLHAVCAKDLINGLHANGISPPEKPTFGKTTRIASQMVIKFVGGFVDGVGNGVGEYLVDSITGGRRGRRSRMENN